MSCPPRIAGVIGHPSSSEKWIPDKAWARMFSAGNMRDDKRLLHQMKITIKKLPKAAILYLSIFLPVSWLWQAHAQEVPEYQLKAAFLYNFAKFIEWPQTAFKDSSTPLVVGILGKDPFGENINFIKNKIVKNRKLKVKYFKSLKDLESCHILFVSSSEKKRLPEILDAVKDSTMLTVSDMDSFIESGGVIRFVLVNDNLGFTINAEAVKHAEFKISSQLLKFGQLVTAESNPTEN